MSTITGRKGSDTLRGTEAGEEILGDPAATTADAFRNLIEAGGGDDTVFAGYGADTVHGGDGDDIIFGAGTYAGPGMGAAALAQQDGADLLDGGAGRDRIEGAGGNDTLRGGDGADALRGGRGADLIQGGTGDDTLQGGLGADRLHGGPGADIFVFGYASAPHEVGLEAGLGAGRDMVMDFTPGEDLLDLSGLRLGADAAWSWRSGPVGVVVEIRAGGESGEILLRGVGSMDAQDVIW